MPKKAKNPTKKTSEKKRILLIVESPSKAKTISKYLGSRYKVVASVGHVRDLPKSKLGVDIENRFEPAYISIRGKGDIIKELKREAKKASRVFLATDPDREGEAISWHLAYLLQIDPESDCRITFNEITKEAVREAIKYPRPIDMGLVDAQQARRLLDRLVGYQISPLLWRKIRKGLSAGRVQSAALKLLCDREREIQAFTPEEFWNIQAHFLEGGDFSARLFSYKGKKYVVRTKEERDRVIRDLRDGSFTVDACKETQRQMKAYPPFTTSSLQQEAGTRLNFSAKRTMAVAQQLYEGIALKGKGLTGLITYLRTDSVRIADAAKEEATSYIRDKFGPAYVGHNTYRNKKKDIQDAHEAIRPTSLHLEPPAIKDSLTTDQYKLYALIWTRFLASCMKEAQFIQHTLLLRNGDYALRASGSQMIFDGFRKVYPTLSDGKEDIIPPLKEGQVLKAASLSGDQTFTQAPARFTEAGLIKLLEEKNIGRPSTYAPIVSTLSERRYVSKVKKALVPTELGFLVDGLMGTYFMEIVDAGFTSLMEDKLDDVERGQLAWKDVLTDFYGPFATELEKADKAIEKIEVEDKPTDEICEKCGHPMVIKTGRYGDFLACSAYPACKNTRPILRKIGVSCPLCGGDLIERRTRRGRLFYGCSSYPACRNVYWNRPTDRICPRCGSLLVEKKSKKAEFACSNPACSYTE